MRVRQKLSMYAICMIVIMIIMGAITFMESAKMKEDIDAITEIWSPSMGCAQEMDTLTSEYRMKQYGHLVATTESDMASYEQDLEGIANQLKEKREEFESRLTLDEEERLYRVIEEKWDLYVSQSEEVLELSRAGKVEEGGELMVGTIYETFQDFDNAFSELLKLEQKELDLAKDSVQEAYTAMRVSISVVVIIGLLFATWMSIVVTKMIADPIKEITKAAEMLNEGDMSAGKEITYESRDELGIVAESLREAMKKLDTYVKEISGTLQEMAKGDLTKDSNEITEFVGDFESIKESFVFILKNFNSTLTEIQNTSEQVSINSNEISDSSQALSAGATEQAGAIEDVIGALDKVVKLSEENSTRTEEVYEQIKTSVDNAEGGRQKMADLTREMERIMELSKRIENISATIEDIASQTNILSLNASVEAARAGEAGKGFAVVAEQIGKLASDSAQSAVDTRGLIGEVLGEIQKGNVITSETSEAFGKMINDMEAFSDAAHNITENAKKEEEALEHVESQIDMISSEIQNTAATSEENSAISENLSEEAIALDKMVKRFKLY